MLSEQVSKLELISLNEVNEISMKIARELVKEGFDMDSLASVEENIMVIVQNRMLELDKNTNFADPIKALYYMALLIETSLYLGINIGREAK